MINASVVEQKRRGRKPKPDKRVPLSLLIEPGLRSQLVDTAKREGRSVTRQTELVLKQGIEGTSFTSPLVASLAANLKKKTNEVSNRTLLLDGYNRNFCLDKDIGSLAAAFLEIKYPGRGKDERIARDLGISAGMAKLLRRGRAWTVARFNQGIKLWPEFRAFVFRVPQSDQITDQLEQLTVGLLRLANEIAELRQELRYSIGRAPAHG